jgi:tripartite-type tricarboxylate transporter receptor subunit TctC
MKTAIRSVLGALLLALALATAGAETYPSRPIRIVVPFAPGGITDLVGRLLADGLRATFGQTVYVENKAGANGTLGARDLVNAPPDGHTLMIGSLGGQVIRAALDKTYPIDPLRDLLPIAGAAEVATVMIVNPRTVPVSSVAEFIAYARQRREELNFGSTGTGSLNHISAELFMQQTGTRMMQVPYKGGSGSVNDLLGGALHVVFEVYPVAMAQIKAGNVRALGVTSPYRLPDLPDVPTLKESGLADFNLTGWLGLYGPPGLAAETRERLGAAVVAIIRDPVNQQKLRAIGFEPTGMPLREFAAFHRSEVERWTAFAIERGLRK